MFDEVFGLVSYATGEFIAWFVGKIIGQTFNIEPQKARKIGEWGLFLTIMSIVVLVTVNYS